MLEVNIRSKREKLRKTIDLFRLGHSIREIAAVLGKSREGVRIQLTKAGCLPQSEDGAGVATALVLRGKVRWNSPYGFQYQRGRAVRHPQEYETLLLILELSEQGLNAREIADRLNARKLRPRIAKRWDRSTVHRVIEWHRQRPQFLKEALLWESRS